MHMIAYISDFTGGKSEIDAVLNDIVKVAKVENQKRVITGVLFYLGGQFLQIIEGEDAALRLLMVNIEKDERHKNIEYLIDTKVEKRGFDQWNMDSFHLGAGKVFSRQSVKDLTESFKKNLIPKSDMLSFYYKTLLKQKTI